MAEEEPQARLPPIQCCCQEPTGLSELDEITWEDTVKAYQDSEAGVDKPFPNFVEVVSSRLSIVHRWLYRLRHIRKPRNEYEKFGLSLSLADVQRMHLRLLQGRLTRLALSAGFDEDGGLVEKVPTTLGPALRDYVQAVRDHEYMGRFRGQSDDPFVVSSDRFLEKLILDKAMARKGIDIDELPDIQSKASATGPWEDGTGPMRPVGGTRTEAFKHAFYSRVAGALVAAAFLIGPMWLLVLKQDVFLQLGVTTGCIAAFGLVMVVSLGTLDAVFAATLAYAAVLMVFVGVVMQGLSGNS